MVITDFTKYKKKIPVNYNTSKQQVRAPLDKTLQLIAVLFDISLQ